MGSSEARGEWDRASPSGNSSVERDDWLPCPAVVTDRGHPGDGLGVGSICNWESHLAGNVSEGFLRAVRMALNSEGGEELHWGQRATAARAKALGRAGGVMEERQCGPGRGMSLRGQIT